MRFLIPDFVVSVVRRLQAAGGQAYLVGGAIRDLILNREPKDYDVATNWLPEDVIRLFPERKAVPSGLRHGTVTLMGLEVSDRKSETMSTEVTTFRIDGDYSDGRRPDFVSFVGNIQMDLARRDFTMNAIAYDPIADQWIDPFDGQSDIRHGVIRAVGDPLRRFAEDALRMIRAIRFAGELDFAIDTPTHHAIRQFAGDIVRVSSERIQTEINRIVMVRPIARQFRLLQETGLLAILLPEVERLKGCKQRDQDKVDAFDHTLAVCEASPQELIIRLSAFFHDIGKPEVAILSPRAVWSFPHHAQMSAVMTEAIMRRLKYSNAMRKSVEFVVRHHTVDVRGPDGEQKLFRLIGAGGVEGVRALAMLRTAHNQDDEMMGQLHRMIEQKVPFKVCDLKISGRDVMNVLDIPPGRDVGFWMNRLLLLVQHGVLQNDYNTLLNHLNITHDELD